MPPAARIDRGQPSQPLRRRTDRGHNNVAIRHRARARAGAGRSVPIGRRRKRHFPLQCQIPAPIPPPHPLTATAVSPTPLYTRYREASPAPRGPLPPPSLSFFLSATRPTLLGMATKRSRLFVQLPSSTTTFLVSFTAIRSFVRSSSERDIGGFSAAPLGGLLTCTRRLGRRRTLSAVRSRRARRPARSCTLYRRVSHTSRSPTRSQKESKRKPIEMEAGWMTGSSRKMASNRFTFAGLAIHSFTHSDQRINF